MSMDIRIADQPDYTEVMSFYDVMCHELGKRAFLHAGNEIKRKEWHIWVVEFNRG